MPVVLIWSFVVEGMGKNVNIEYQANTIKMWNSNDYTPSHDCNFVFY